MEPSTHKKSGDALFNKKSESPNPKSNYVDVLPWKNAQVRTSSFRKAAAAEQVVLDFGDDYGFWENYKSLDYKDDYGFWENYLCLEEEVASASRQNQEGSKSLDEVGNGKRSTNNHGRCKEFKSTCL